MFGWLPASSLCLWAWLSSPLLINCWIVRRKKQNLEKEINGVENKWWWLIKYLDTFFLQLTLFLYLSFIISLMKKIEFKMKSCRTFCFHNYEFINKNLYLQKLSTQLFEKKLYSFYESWAQQKVCFLFVIQYKLELL